MSLYRRLIQKTLKEGVTPFTGDRSKLSWRKKILKEFGEWVPIANVGPTNAVSTTFGYFSGGVPVVNGETGQPITYTTSGIGGVETLPNNVTIDFGYGESINVDAPTYNQLALAGYAPLLPFFRREDYKDINAMLDASQEYARRTLSDIYMSARVEQDIIFKREEKEREERYKKLVNYVNTLGVDMSELQINGSALDKFGRLIVLNHDGGIFGSKYSNKTSITIYNPYKDSEGNIHKTYYAGIGRPNDPQFAGKFSGDAGQISSPDENTSRNMWANVGSVAHYTDFGSTHNPNEIGEVLIGDKKVGNKIVGDKAIGKEYSDILDQLAKYFKVGSAKNIFDYHINWQKNPTTKPQDVTKLLSSSDLNALQNLVNQFANDKVAVEDSINANLQRVIDASPGLRNSLGNIDFSRGDGAKIVGNNIVIKKAYDFDGLSDIGGAGILTGIPASIYGSSKMGTKALTGTDTMNMIVKIPIKNKKIQESNTWSKIMRHLKN